MKLVPLPHSPITTRRIGLNAAAQWAQTIVTAVALLFLTPMLLDGLGKSGYGMWSIAFTTVQVLVSLDFGMQSATRRFMARFIVGASRVDLYRAFNSSLAIMLVVSAVLVAAMIALGWLLPYVSGVRGMEAVEFREAIWVLAAGIPFSMVMRPFHGVIAGLQQGYKSALAATIGYLTFVVMAVICLETGHSDLRLLAVAVVLHLVVFLGLTAWWAWKPLGHIAISFRYVRSEYVREMLHFGKSAFLLPVAMVAYNLDTQLIGAFVSTATVAYYRIPIQLIMFIRMLAMGISQPLLPVATQLRQSGQIELLKDLYHSGARLTGSLVVMLLLPLVIFGEVFIGNWLPGQGMAWTWQLLAIMSLGQFIAIMSMPGEQMLLGAGRTGRIGIANVAGAAVKLAATVLVLTITPWELIGVAWATTVPLLASGLVVLYCMCSQNSISAVSYFASTLGRVTVAALPAGGLLLVLRGVWVPESFFVSIIQVAFGAALCGVSSWFLALTEQDRTYMRALLWTRTNTEAA